MLLVVPLAGLPQEDLLHRVAVVEQQDHQQERPGGGVIVSKKLLLKNSYQGLLETVHNLQAELFGLR